MTPAPSLWGMTIPSLTGRLPARDFTSEGFTPEHTTRTTTSCSPGSCIGCSPTCRTSRAGPLRSYQAAFMLYAFLNECIGQRAQADQHYINTIALGKVWSQP